MSGSMSGAHGSADITAELNLQPRLVIAPQARNAGDDIDACAYLSLPKIEQDSGLSSELQDHAALHANRRIPTPTDNDDGRSSVRLWVACLAGILERFVWYGVTAPIRAWYLSIYNVVRLTVHIENYLQNAPGGVVPGALGLHQATASNIVNALIIGSYIVPVPVAVVTDSWLGRYKTMIYADMYCEVLFLYIHPGLPVCLMAKTITASRPSGQLLFLRHPCPGIQDCADQYDETEFRIKTQKGGKRVVTSRELAMTYIYNVFYWAINVVCFVADCTPLLERYVGFWLAYLVSCCAMWLALIPILLGHKHFIRHSPTSNIMPQICAALRYGIASGFKMDAAKPDAQLHQHGRQVPWADSFIEEIKRRFLFPIHWLCYNQIFSNLISQAGQMVTYGIPNDMMKIAGPISGIIIAPIVQKGLYPYVTKRRISFGPIARMTVGFIFLTLSMVYTTVIQMLIYQAGPCYDAPLPCAASNGDTVPNQVSVFLQVPTYFGGGLAEVFCLTTGTEYAYNHAPKSMKTLVQAIWLAMAGVGTCLALAFTPLTKDPHLVMMYAILTGLLGGAIILLWILFRSLDKSKVKEDVE
ncbi:hypothetical protein HAV15_006823 [Penicillium sp. str. |nr:hypothetical protein HAV15_006823 [Penicillium sp. str. \